MAKIGEILKTRNPCKTARNLSVEERHEGGKLSSGERAIAKTQEEYDAEVARLKAEDQARAARIERLRQAAKEVT